MNPILRDFAIHTNVCVTPSKAASLLAESDTDLIVLDLEGQDAAGLVDQILESCGRRKPTILAVSEVDCAIPGVHVVLRKPVTPVAGTTSVKTAYSRMLQDYRKHTRFAVMAPVLASDENNATIRMTVTNIGEGGVGLTTKENLKSGTVLSFCVPLPGLAKNIYISARVLWTRPYGIAGCEFVRIFPADLQILHAWLESRYRFEKPLISV
jgi:PilZ domain